MRTDVKLGVVVAMVVVLVAGGYYMYRDREQQPIPMSNKVASGTSEASKPKPTKSAPKRQTTGRTGDKTPAASRQAARDRARSTPKRSERTQPNQAGRNPNSERTASRTPTTKPGNRRQTPNSRNAKRPGQDNSRAQDKKVAQGPTKRAQPTQRNTPNRSNTAVPTRSRQNAQPKRDTSSAKQLASGDRPAATPEPAVKLPPVNIADSSKPVTPNKRQGVPLTALPAGAEAAVEKHRVQPGDTLAGLSVQYYGSERHTQFLIDANRHLANPNRLRIGDAVNIPAAPTGRRTAASDGTGQPDRGTPSSGSSSRAYTVKPGDSFYKIAQDQLGDASRWKELLQLNRELVGGEPTALRAGQVVRLPQ